MWTQLLWKDWRVNRVVIAGGAVLTACPYASTLLLEYYYPRSVVQSAAGFRASIGVAAMMALIVTVLMAAVFGGAAFASERRERSAEFLGMLPVTRRRAVLAKLLFAGACVAAMWLLHVAVLSVVAPLTPGMNNESWAAVHLFGPIILMAFGVGWLFSSFLRSPGLAAGIAVGVTICTTWGLAAAVDAVASAFDQWGRARQDYVHSAVQAWTLGTGLLCLLTGSAYYVRRVEP